MAQDLTVAVERFPIAGRFTIARGSRTEAAVATATIAGDGAVGRGECVPYARYGETVEGVAAAIESVRPRVETGLDRFALQELLPPGAARNALDCALWDFEAKRTPRAGARRRRPATASAQPRRPTPDQPRCARSDGGRRRAARPSGRS